MSDGIKKKRKQPCYTNNVDYRTIERWLSENFTEDSNGVVSKDAIYNMYVIYCKSNRIKVREKNIFGKYVKRIFPSSFPRRLGSNNELKPFYSGFRFKTTEEPYVIKWVKKNYVLDCNYQVVSLNELYNEYIFHCELDGYPPESIFELDRGITLSFDNIEKRVMDNETFYFGISKIMRFLDINHYTSYLNSPVENYYRQNFECL